MQLTITTDYAIRTVICLGTGEGCMTAETISTAMCIPQKYLAKILKKLKEAGMVQSISGANGGYKLKKELSNIRLGDILEIMEVTMKINRCLEADEFCSRNAQRICSVRKFYKAVQEEMEAKIMGITVQDLLERY